MLASKINCLNSKYPRNSFSLKNPDVAKEFLATAFYHNAAAAKDSRPSTRTCLQPRRRRL